jgi:uncharacterized protein
MKGCHMLRRQLRTLAVCLCFGLMSSAALAQQKAPVLDPAAVTAAKELMQAMGVDAQFDVVIETMTKGMASALRQKQPSKGKEIDEVMSKMAAKFRSRKNDMIEMTAPLYAEKFTVGELKEIGTFYKTPIGQKMLKVQPEIMQRSMQMGMVWGQKLGQEVENEARDELKKRGIDL